MTTMTVITWTPPAGRQTVALRAAGLSVDDLRSAGFRWGRSQSWEAPETPEAQALVERLNKPSALELACADAGIPLETSGAADLERQATRLVAKAHEGIAGIPGGQPVGSTTDANRREKSADKMRKASALFAQAEAKREKVRETARGLAARLERQAENCHRPRETNTPKRLAQAMHTRLEGDRYARAAKLLLEWAEDPSRLPEWKPKADTAIAARRRDLKPVQNGWHSYHVETDELQKTTDATVLALRRAYPEGKAKPDPRAEIMRLEADIRFSPIPGFFPTPPSLIERIMELADIRHGQRVLEPSAGKGDLADAARGAGGVVECCEINGRLREILAAKGHKIIADDCTELQPYSNDQQIACVFDRIVMNPPFERGQDRDHIRKMFDHLAPGGRIVSVCSTGPFFRSQSADVDFRDWIERVGAEVEDVEPGAFSGSDAFRQTGVSVKLVVIDRGEP